MVKTYGAIRNPEFTRTGPDRIETGPGSGNFKEYFWVESDRGLKIYYFLVRSGSGQKITGHYGIRVPKTLPAGL